MRISGILSACRAISRGRIACPPRPPLHQSPTCHPAAIDGKTFLSASNPSLQAIRIPRPPTCHGAAAVARNYSSTAGPTRPERLAVPLHLLLGQSSSRTGASIARSFSSQSDNNIHLPNDNKTNKIPGPNKERLPLAKEIIKLSVPNDIKILLPSQQKIIVPFQKGVIRPDLGYFRPPAARVNSEDRPRLPIIRQISFYEEEDIHLTEWETPMVSLRRIQAFQPAAKNPLIEDHNGQAMMHTAQLWRLWKSGADLVSSNKHRGYCISKSLVEENLVVSCMEHLL